MIVLFYHILQVLDNNHYIYLKNNVKIINIVTILNLFIHINIIIIKIHNHYLIILVNIIQVILDLNKQ